MFLSYYQFSLVAQLCPTLCSIMDLNYYRLYIFNISVPKYLLLYYIEIWLIFVCFLSYNPGKLLVLEAFLWHLFFLP